MHQKLFLLLFIVFNVNLLNLRAQTNRPSIVWQKCFGGTKHDRANDVIITTDGGVLVVGSSGSNDGDVVNHNGSTDSTDGWVIKLYGDTNILWQHSLGGPADDAFTSVVKADDSSYYCIGYTTVEEGAINFLRLKKVWVVKLSSAGNIIWSKTFRAAYQLSFVNGLTVSDGGLVVSGEQFVFKINPAGDVLWDIFTDQVYFFVASVIENSQHQLLTSNGYMIDNSTGDTTNLHPPLPPLSDIGCITNEGDKIFLAYNQRLYNEFCFDGSGFSAGYNNSSKVGYFNYPNINEMVSEEWYLSNCPDGGRYGGPSVGTALHGLAILPGNSFITVGGVNTVYWEPKSQACLYTGGVFGLYGAPRADINWTEFRSVKVYPSGNEFICVGNTNANGGDVTGKHGFEGSFTNDMWVVKLSTVNRIQGNVFIDINNNNIKDEGEPNFNEAKVNCTSAHLNTQVKPLDGQYSFTADTGSYITKVSLPNSYYTVFPDSAISTFVAPGSRDTIDFAIHKTTDAKDYSISLAALSPVRPGFGVMYKISYANKGTDTLHNKTIQFIKDSRFNLGQTTPSFANVSGDTVTWNINSLLPGSNGEIIINMVAALPGEVNMGDSLLLYALLDSTGDVNVSDNIDSVKQFVTGSYDPNNKQEDHSGLISLLEVQNADYFNYTIRFQNTGNDTAFTVIVRDDLDEKLDWSTFKMTSASHAYQLKIKDGKYLEWKFNDILLVDSVHNEPASHGYIRYQIKPKASLNLGDEINNSASIYFDFNAPIKTNTQITTVIKNTAIWTGAQNDAWENAANWNINVVPDSETMVIIPANVPNYPVVNSNVTCFTLRVDKTATITINEGFDLQVTGK